MLCLDLSEWQNQVQTAITTVFLRRLDDPDHEYRRMDVYEQDDYCLLFESIFFAGTPEMYRTSLTSIDSKEGISRRVENEINRLCREDGFRVVSREGMDHLAMKEPHPVE